MAPSNSYLSRIEAVSMTEKLATKPTTNLSHKSGDRDFPIPHNFSLTFSTIMASSSHAVASIHSYRSAIALNNLSISLLSLGQYEEAMKTSNDALQIMRHMFLLNEDCFQTIQDQKAYASTRYSCARDRWSTKVSGSLSLGGQQQAEELEICEIDDDHCESVQAMTQRSPSNALLPILLKEPLDCQVNSLSNHMVARHIGLVLYNQGLVHYASAISLDRCKAAKKDNMLACAIKCFRHAQSTFEHLAQNRNGIEETEQSRDQDCNVMKEDGGHHMVYCSLLATMSHCYLVQATSESEPALTSKASGGAFQRESIVVARAA